MNAALQLVGLSTARGGHRGGPFDLRVEPGMARVLTGPNGSGKSTLLETIAGLLPAVGGQVSLGGSPWTNAVPPWRRDVSVLLQRLGLWPHQTIREQVQLVSGGNPAPEIGELAERLELTALLDRRPAELSGGEAQRAALLRTLAPGRTVLLLDEPTSAQHEDTVVKVRAVIEEQLAAGCVALIAAHGGWGGYEEFPLGR